MQGHLSWFIFSSSIYHILSETSSGTVYHIKRDHSGRFLILSSFIEMYSVFTWQLKSLGVTLSLELESVVLQRRDNCLTLLCKFLLRCTGSTDILLVHFFLFFNFFIIFSMSQFFVKYVFLPWQSPFLS